MASRAASESRCFDRRQDALVMKLPALRPAVHIKNAAALLAQQPDDRIKERKNQRISGRFRQRQMEIKIGFDISVGIMQVAIHHGHRFAHGRKQLFFDSLRGQSRNFRLRAPTATPPDVPSLLAG